MAKASGKAFALSSDAQDVQGRKHSIPTHEEIAPIVNEQLIVELYSKA